MIKKLLTGISASRIAAQRASNYRDRIRQEAAVGGELFGAIPSGHRREFFCLDQKTWVWHEEWLDTAGVRQVRTTRYDVRPNGIVKALDGNGYQSVSREEATNLLKAAELYQRRIRSDVYHLAT